MKTKRINKTLGLMNVFYNLGFGSNKAYISTIIDLLNQDNVSVLVNNDIAYSVIDFIKLMKKECSPKYWFADARIREFSILSNGVCNTYKTWFGTNTMSNAISKVIIKE